MLNGLATNPGLHPDARVRGLAGVSSLQVALLTMAPQVPVVVMQKVTQAGAGWVAQGVALVPLLSRAM